MRRIIVGIDGSEQGWSALAQGADLARATGAALQIVHVLPALLQIARGPLEASHLAAHDHPVAPQSWVLAQETFAQGLLREAVARVKEAGVEVNTVTKTGPTAETLAELAAPPEVSLVVVGHRGRNLAARLLIGSVADRLVQISPKPVLVIR